MDAACGSRPRGDSQSQGQPVGQARPWSYPMRGIRSCRSQRQEEQLIVSLLRDLAKEPRDLAELQVQSFEWPD